MQATLTSKGQVTIPKAARDFLRLSAGDQVKFFFHPDGHLVILPKLPITVLRGIVAPRPDGPVSIDEMDEALAQGAVARFESSIRR